MDIIEKLNESYETLKKSANPYEVIFDFKEALLSSDSPEVLDFHYKIIHDDGLSDKLKGTIKSFFYADAANKRNRDKVADFLYNKYKAGIEDIGQRADVIQLLGNLRSKYAKEVALENITIRKADLRYRSIIVLGWVGGKTELKVLDDRLLNDPDPQLRGYAASAMRQIWFNHPKTKDEILVYIKNAIDKETEDKALTGMVLTVQELLKKKLGLKESQYGDVSGDVQAAKEKTVKALKDV